MVVTTLVVATPSAMAYKEFIVRGPIKDKGLEKVTINVGSYSAGCSKELPKGETLENEGLKVPHFEDMVEYGECSLPSLKFVFNVNGTVEIENTLELKYGSCVVTMPGGQKFKEAAKYEGGEPVSHMKAKTKFKGISFKEKGTCKETIGPNGYSDWQEFEGIEPA
jgi:hypothetical protein